MSKLLTVDPATVDDISPTFEVGALYHYKHPTYGWGYYRYYQFLDAVTYVAGHVLTLANAATYGVTNDVAAGSSVGKKPMGVATRVHTQNYFGFAQVGGLGAYALLTDGGVAAGHYLVADVAGGIDGGVDSMAAGEEHEVFGFALAADVSTAQVAGSWYFKGVL